jgi:hypothetical protein
MLLNKLKRRIFEALIKIKNTEEKEKMSFCVFEQKNPKCYFPESFSLTIHLKY